jgi:hypothetical protein
VISFVSFVVNGFFFTTKEHEGLHKGTLRDYRIMDLRKSAISAGKIFITKIKKKNLSLYNKPINKTMEILADILKITLPALIVLLTAWLVLQNLIRNDQDKRKQELILQNSRTVTPIKLQAYERIVLFLERISLESLLLRVSVQDMTAQQLHNAMLNAVRSEFEHNLSQQIYMSQQAWEVVRNARSNMIKIINSEAEKLPADSSAMTLSKKLLEKIIDLEQEPTRAAIDFVKAEIGRMI